MARATRSKQALISSNSETESTRITRKTSITRSRKNTLDANSNSPVKNGRVLKNSQSKASVTKSKLHAKKTDSSSVIGNNLLAMKSPVLRDRTNTTNDLVKVNASAKKPENLHTDDKKKLVKAVMKCNTKIVAKKQKVQNENAPKVTAEKNTIGNTFKQVISQKNSGLLKVKNNEKDTQLRDNDDNGKNINLQTDKNAKSQNENSNTNRVLRKKNISIETVEQLLNEDDEVDFVSNEKDTQKKPEVENIEKDVTTRVVGENKVNKKFFKNKEEMNTIPVKKTFQAKINKRKKDAKKIEADVSSFSPTLNEQRQSTRQTYNVRSRANKNYCELSVLSNSNADEKVKAEKAGEVDKELKKIPIYKTIQLSQENVKDKEEIYEYLDDSQEDNGQKGKKKKRVAKKPTVKRTRKAATSKIIIGQKVQKKTTKKVPTNIQSKEQKEILLNTQKTLIKNNVKSNVVLPSAENNIQINVELPECSKQIIPEHLLNAGDSTIAEASTIKIISDQKLESSRKFNLTLTPPVPKTITSELRLFGPKNVITSKPTTIYKNMVNHSLIRKSMSPITKVVDNFDTGSPWRAIDAFSRVSRMVQSTPQINRLPSMREKKLPVHLSDLNKKSLNSEETVHISSMMEDKSSDKTEKSIIPTKNQNDISPRKFGTTISNLSPVKSISKSPVQNNVQSLMQTTSPPMAFSEIPIDQEGLSILENHNKENTVTSPTKSPRKKISTPSPFRFEKIRSSKRIASTEYQSKTPKATIQKKFQETEPEAGPSHLEKSKSTVLRQSNLNNFLNLDEVPESTRISTKHGIFDDIHSTPITGKKSKCLTEEANIDNAFGFNDSDVSETISPNDTSSGSIIATEQDIKHSVKGKLFPKARVKSFMPSRISANTIKKTLLRNVITKKKPEKKQCETFKELDGSDSEKENETTKEDAKNNNEHKKSLKEIALDAASFSDTFDVYSENGDIQSKVPEEIPLFVDLEPVHFTKPPRRSYNKRKRAVNINTSKEFESDEEDYEQQKSKKKKTSKLSKEENKRMKEWLKNINKTFDEIEHYDLVIE